MEAQVTDRKEWIPGVLAIMITLMVAAAALLPYVWVIPDKNLTLITQAQTTLYSGWMFMLGFFYGQSNLPKKTPIPMPVVDVTDKGE